MPAHVKYVLDSDPAAIFCGVGILSPLRLAGEKHLGSNCSDSDKDRSAD